MCSVSVVSDYFGQRVPSYAWDHDTFNDYKKVIALLEKLDAKFDQAECVDPEKERWIQKVELRLEALERAGKITQS